MMITATQRRIVSHLIALGRRATHSELAKGVHASSIDLADLVKVGVLDGDARNGYALTQTGRTV